MGILEQLRTEVGLAMGGRYRAQSFKTTDEDGGAVTVARKLHVGWTTDEGKANRARELGATVTAYRAHDPAFSGWEVSVNEVVE